MAPPNIPSSRAVIRRVLPFTAASIAVIPAVGYFFLELARRRIVDYHLSFLLAACGGTAYGLFVVAYLIRSLRVQERRLEDEAIARRSLTARLEGQATTLHREMTARERELESANASLRLATKMNALLALCAQQMPSGVIITDALGKIVWANLAWEKLSGSGQAECAGKPVDIILGQIFAEFKPGRGREILDAGLPASFELRIHGKDGAARWLAIAFQPVHVQAREVVNFIVIVDDFTARREADLKLQTANDRLQLALQSSGYGIWQTDLTNERLEWDARMYEIYGVDPSSFGGTTRDWLRLIHPDDMESLEIHRLQVLDGTLKNYDIDFRIRRLDGKVRHIEAHGFLARDPTGAPMRLVGLNRDITSEMEIRENLHHSQEIAIRVSRLAQIGAWTLQSPSRRLRWQPELYRICEVELGYEPTLQKMSEFFPGEHQAAFIREIEQTESSGGSFDFECPLVTALGQRRWVHVFGQAETKEGRVQRIFGAVQDITARHEAEEATRKLETQLFQVQKMETLGTLAGGIAHDFNNLLTGIIGHQDLALDVIPEGHASRQSLAEARLASMRACELVEQILVFSRQSGGSERVSVDLCAMVEEARRFLRAATPATIRIEVQAAGDCGRVLADPSQLNQVLLNLGTNAVHAMRDMGGVLSFGLAGVKLAASQAAGLGNLSPGTYLRLTVSDTGHGMNAETQKRIFDPFFTTKGVGEGTGLGLSIVHGIVRSHGGAIEVMSTLGEGTTFHIYLPVADTTGDDVPVAEAPLPRGNGEVVCVVDDEHLVAQAARLSLERFGYLTVVFSNAAECLRAMRGQPDGCSVLLSDQTMPGMTGMELSAEVRRFAPDLPIIIMSGYFSKVSAGALEEIGRISLLAKPFTSAELARTVHRALHPEVASV